MPEVTPPLSRSKNSVQLPTVYPAQSSIHPVWKEHRVVNFGDASGTLNYHDILYLVHVKDSLQREVSESAADHIPGSSGLGSAKHAVNKL